MWMRDTLTVSLRLPANATVSDSAVNSAVLGKLATVLKDKGLGILSPTSSSDQRRTLARGGGDATAFYSLTPVSDSDSSLSAVCDQRVIEAVDAVNELLGAKTSQGSTVLTPVVVEATGTDATGAQISVPVSILGASPDWILTGRPTGSGFGHPGGPPRLPGSSFSLDEASDSTAVSADAGAGTTVVVLDTGYQLDKIGGLPSPAVSCGADACVPAPKPLFNASKVTAAMSSSQNGLLVQLSREVQESDMQVATDSPEAGSSDSGPLAEFFDTSGNPVNIVDHGLFISGLIHQAAPAAKIVLIRVLNDYGVGDLRSILTAVDTVANHPDQLGIAAGQRVVVNMSLGFGPSASCLAGTYRNWLAIQKGNAEAKQPYNYDCVTNKVNEGSSSLISSGPAGAPGVDAALTLPLSVAISDLAAGSDAGKLASITVVAAAGNESTGVKPALDADLPAGICGVVPVAALTYAGGSPSQAAFSNNPSLSGNQCLNIAVSSSSVTVSLHGETRPSVSAAGVNDCGVFLQPIPSATLNGVTTSGGSTAPNAEALWDGTSFAAGWASGYIARAGMPSGSSFTVPDMQKCNLA